MPNRLLKDSICTSPTVDALSADEERFFYRLVVNCDDYGLMDARDAILRAKLYPLKINKVSTKAVHRWLGRLAEVGLLDLYEVDDRPYLKMRTWEKHQQIRALKPRYPQPISSDIKGNQAIANVPVIQSNPNPNPNPIHGEKTNAPNGAGGNSHPKEKRDDQLMWDSFVSEIGVQPETKGERGKWNVGIKELRDAGVLPDEVPALVESYHDHFKNAACNPRAIANNLSEIRRVAVDVEPVSNGEYYTGDKHLGVDPWAKYRPPRRSEPIEPSEKSSELA